MRTAAPEALDLGGVTLPDFGGSAVDALQARFLAGLADAATTRALAAAERASPVHRQVCERIARGVSDLAPHDRIHAFRSPLAVSHLEGAGSPCPAPELQLARFLIGGGLPEFACVLPKETFEPAGGIYLPHLHLWLDSEGPLAVEATHETVRVTDLDGRVLTLPAQGLPGRAEAPGMRAEARVGDLALLNGLPELATLAEHLTTHPLARVDDEPLQILARGLDLLAEAWPEAYASAKRFFRAVWVQPVAVDHVSSISHDRLQGALIASLRDPVQCADALVHESAHQRLSLVLRLDPLLLDDGAATHPSPWRKDPRPLKGILNGIHSFVCVAAFYRRLAELDPQEAPFAEAVFEAQRAKLREGWAYLRPRAVPTPTGERLLAELDEEVRKL